MKRILIVEDEQLIAELERDYLEVSGYATDIAADGEKGLRLGLSGEYDLILLDVMLPVMNGFEVCKRLREVINLPILMVTAKKEDIDVIKGLGLGADDYITKPFKPGELVARVKAHLARYERIRGEKEHKEVIEAHGLTIDYGARRVYLGEREVVLTTKELELLYFLASNPDRVFSKDHLFERIWGIHALGDTQTVTVHIRKLREKLEGGQPPTEFIETVWGAGYRFRL
ncbi:response regulator transcription factor [Paenibacillus athensensis]|uniref:DNA-binding response regulator n=1 Tax=Paenibacillus athensensis TaxID=1967502 RepID=A0A4Y8PZL3_9BACL|nr:response regulator transcription factor [Paenibacillus athensensis]MCD1259691.1 response regulator transcription factor [Paenibacillus athensensis]